MLQAFFRKQTFHRPAFQKPGSVEQEQEEQQKAQAEFHLQ